MVENKNMKITVKKCSEEEAKKCDHIMSEREWNGNPVCLVMRPIDCPLLEEVCNGEPCMLGALVNTNNEEIEFPCSFCEKPSKEETKENFNRFLKDIKGEVRGDKDE